MSFGEEPIRNPPVLDPALGPPHAAITCPTCGYDLRGGLARGVCPECATPKTVALERAAEGA
jgi:rubrerythrin